MILYFIISKIKDKNSKITNDETPYPFSCTYSWQDYAGFPALAKPRMTTMLQSQICGCALLFEKCHRFTDQINPQIDFLRNVMVSILGVPRMHEWKLL